MTRREIALRLWERELGKPYNWGGQNPLEGFDCSGLVIEGLKAVGVLPKKGDWTARGLRDRFKGKEIQSPTPGCLLFWNRGSQIGHVEIVWQVVDGGRLTIGASGGGSKTHTEQDAIDQDAYIKVRPATPNWVVAVDPFIGG